VFSKAAYTWPRVSTVRSTLTRLIHVPSKSVGFIGPLFFDAFLPTSFLGVWGRDALLLDDNWVIADTSRVPPLPLLKLLANRGRASCAQIEYVRAYNGRHPPDGARSCLQPGARLPVPNSGTAPHGTILALLQSVRALGVALKSATSGALLQASCVTQRQHSGCSRSHIRTRSGSPSLPYQPHHCSGSRTNTLSAQVKTNTGERILRVLSPQSYTCQVVHVTLGVPESLPCQFS
jgi:hypothetical protein